MIRKSLFLACLILVSQVFFCILILLAGCGIVNKVTEDTDVVGIPATTTTLSTTTTINHALPSRPTGFSAIPREKEAAVDLKWDKDWESDLSGYNIYRSTSSEGNYEKIKTIFTPATTYSDENEIERKSSYYYKITAVDKSSNESSFSDMAKVTTPIYFLKKQIGVAGTVEGQFSEIKAISLDKNGNLYVADHTRIQKFDKDGNFIKTWIFSDQSYSVAIAIDRNDYVYVCTSAPAPTQVIKFDSNGNFIKKWSMSGDKIVDFVANKVAGYLYFLKQSEGCVYVYDTEGNYLFKWGEKGAADGQFVMPCGICEDKNGNMYVFDHGNKRVQKFNISGTFLKKINFDVPDFNFGHHCGIAIDGNNNIYLRWVSLDNTIYGLITKIDNSGNVIEEWKGAFGSSAEIALDEANGFFYIDVVSAVFKYGEK